MSASFWDRTNALIKQQNKTQSSVSVDCGFNARRIQNLSGAERMPDVFEAYKIAQALNTTVEYLVTGKHTNNAEKIAQIKNLLLQVSENLDILN